MSPVFIKKEKVIIYGLVIFILVAAVYLFVRPAPQTFYLAENIISKNQEFSELLADLLQKKIDRTIILGNLYLEQYKISDLIKDGKWEQAIQSLKSLIEENDFVTRVFLVDSEGIPKADFPPLPYKEQSFAFRDWYKGVMAKESVYVSEVYKRSAEPQLNVIVFAFPIKDNDSIIGILGIQVATNIWLSWVNEIKITPESIIFVVDKNGHIMVHPDIDPQAEIVDFSSEPDVKKLLQGRASTEFIIDPKIGSFISSYKVIPGYNMGIVVRVSIKVD